MWRLPVTLAFVVGCGPDSGTTDASDTTTDTEPTTDSPGDPTVIQGLSNVLGGALYSISGSSADKVWICGANDGQGPQLYLWDGSTWARPDASALAFDFWWLWNDGEGTLWIGGSNGQMASFDIGLGVFTPYTVADPGLTFFGVWGSSPTDVWAVAGDPSSGTAGAIYHYDGTAWTLSAEATIANGANRGVFKVWGRSATDVTAVGTGALVMNWDGTSWTEVATTLSPTTTLFTVAGDSTQTLAVGGFGNGAAVTIDGATSTNISPNMATAFAPGFVGVWDDDANDPLVSGNNGTLWWYRGGAWEQDARVNPYTDGIHAVWIDPEGGIWGVGGDLTTGARGSLVYSGTQLVEVL